MEDEIEPTDPAGSGVEPAAGSAPLPFEGLVAPDPIDPSPPAAARWLAFGSVLLGGVLGALVGYGIGEVMGGTATWAAVGALVGGATGAIGVGVVANLTLRAMSEWRAVEHPEATAEGRGRRPQRRGRHWTRRPSV